MRVRLFIPTLVLMLVCALPSLAQVVVSGTVTGKSDGQPLPGTGVRIEGTMKGTATDLDGRYTIEAKSGDVLSFTFIGMRVAKVVVGDSTTGKVSIDVALEIDEGVFEEVVVVGYTKTSEQNLATTTSTVESDKVEGRAVVSTSEVLQGLAPSLLILPNASGGDGGGAPGQGMNVRIRGSTSAPLILVDGTEQAIDTVDPDDIASVTVLEDLASASIYGARAADGVLLIETKSGAGGDPTVNYSSRISISHFRDLPEKPNSYEFAKAYRDAWDNGGSTHRWYFTDAYLERVKNNMDKTTISEDDDINDDGDWDRGEWVANTDAYKNSFKDYTTWVNHNLSVSGTLRYGEPDELGVKNKKIQYRISGAYFGQDGMLKTNMEDSYVRKTVGLNLSLTPIKWLTARATVNYADENFLKPMLGQYRLGSYGGSYGIIFHQIVREWPVSPYTTDDGNPIDNTNGYLSQLSQYEDDERRLVGKMGFELNPVKGWKVWFYQRFKRRSDERQRYIKRAYRYNVAGDKILMNSGKAGHYQRVEWMWTYDSPQLFSEYEWRGEDPFLGEKHYFKVNAGFEQEYQLYNYVSLSKKDVVSDDTPSIDTATGEDDMSENKSEWSTRSYYGQLFYTFGERYVINNTFRRDGSSKFRDGKRWGTFFSWGLAYNVHKEPILKDYLKSIKVDGLKLKFSMGQAGDQNIGNYSYLETLNIRSRKSWIADGERDLYTSSPSIADKDITWEKVKDTNLGFSLALLDKRLNMGFTYYQKTTTDMLGPVAPLSSVLGTSAPRDNNAEMEDKGFSYSLTWKDKVGDDFSYDVTFYLSDSEIKYTKYYNPQKLLSRIYEGRKVGEIWGYETVGIMDESTAEKVEANSQNSSHEATDGYANQRFLGNRWSEGDIRYKDLNGDGKIDNGESTLDDPGDRKIIGNSRARYNYTIDTNFKWKGIGLRLFFQGTGSRQVDLSGSNMGLSGVWDYAFKDHLDYWRPDNKDAFYPKPYFNTSKNRRTQTRYLAEAAYLRLKNVTVSYTFDKDLVGQIGLKATKVYFTTDNLITFKSSKIPDYLDPELTGGFWGGAGKVHPLFRTYSVGVNLKF